MVKGICAFCCIIHHNNNNATTTTMINENTSNNHASQTNNVNHGYKAHIKKENNSTFTDQKVTCQHHCKIVNGYKKASPIRCIYWFSFLRNKIIEINQFTFSETYIPRTISQP